jgi:hypothetical protein
MGASAKTAELVGHVHAIETRVTPSALDAALLEARLIREHKPPYNRMLKGAAPAYFVRLDLTDPFPRLVISTRLVARRGVMQLGPFVGRAGVERAARLRRRVGLAEHRDRRLGDCAPEAFDQREVQPRAGDDHHDVRSLRRRVIQRLERRRGQRVELRLLEQRADRGDDQRLASDDDAQRPVARAQPDPTAA